MNSNCAAKNCTITNRNTTMDTKTLRQRYLTLRYVGNLYRKIQTMNLHLFCLNASKRKKSD